MSADRDHAAPVSEGPPREAHRDRVAPAALVAALLAVIGVAASVWRPVAEATPRATELARFGPEVLAAVAAYRTPVRVAGVLGLALTVVVPLAVAGTPAGRRLVARIVGGSRAAWRGAAVALAVGVLLSLARLPLRIWVGWFHDGAWGFRTATWPVWTRDWFVGEAVTWLVAAVMGAVLVVAVRRWPRSWQWRLVPIGTGLTAVLMLGYPVVVEPLIYATEPVPPGAVREEVAGVLRAAGEPDTPIVVADASRRTTKVNAYVSGLGPTRRVVLYDTLLDRDPDEVGLVVAHELAHREHGDLPRAVMLSAVGFLGGAAAVRWVWTAPWVHRRVGARDGTDPRLVAAAVAVVAVANVVVLPGTNWLSRRAEAAADERAMELTGDPATFVGVARSFTTSDLASPDPPSYATHLWGTHPSVGRRIRAAAAVAVEDGLPLPSLADLRRSEAQSRHPAIPSGES